MATKSSPKERCEDCERLVQVLKSALEVLEDVIYADPGFEESAEHYYAVKKAKDWLKDAKF